MQTISNLKWIAFYQNTCILHDTIINFWLANVPSVRCTVVGIHLTDHAHITIIFSKYSLYLKQPQFWFEFYSIVYPKTYIL